MAHMRALALASALTTNILCGAPCPAHAGGWDDPAEEEAFDPCAGPIPTEAHYATMVDAGTDPAMLYAVMRGHMARECGWPTLNDDMVARWRERGVSDADLMRFVFGGPQEHGAHRASLVPVPVPVPVPLDGTALFYLVALVALVAVAIHRRQS